MRRALLLLLALGLTACGGDDGAGRPPEIVYGRDVCTECGMIISEERFAAAYEVEGEDKAFDDVGDMLAHGLRQGELGSETAAWVHDHDTSEWLDAATAWFVHDADIVTPMGHGIAAFSTRERATSFATEFGGEVMTWDDLLLTAGSMPADHDHSTHDPTP